MSGQSGVVGNGGADDPCIPIRITDTRLNPAPTDCLFTLWLHSGEMTVNRGRGYLGVKTI